MHGLTRSLVNNMVIGVTRGLHRKELQIVGVGYRALAKGRQGPGTAARLQPSRRRQGPGWHHVRRPGTHAHHRGLRHRQAGRRPGGRRHPFAPQARALQGQGRAVRRRVRGPQGRKGRRSERQDHRSSGLTPQRPTPPGSSSEVQGTAARPVWRCSVRPVTSRPRSSTTTTGTRWPSASTQQAGVAGWPHRRCGGHRGRRVLWPSGPRPPGSTTPSCSTAAATSTTAGWRRLPTPPVTPDWSSSGIKKDHQRAVDAATTPATGVLRGHPHQPRRQGGQGRPPLSRSPHSW